MYGTLFLYIAPGIAMPPAGSCFTDATFLFKMSPIIPQQVDGSQRGLLRQHRRLKKITTATHLVTFGPVTPDTCGPFAREVTACIS